MTAPGLVYNEGAQCDLKADLAVVSSALDRLKTYLADRAFPTEDLDPPLLAVAEALNNGIIHGARDKPDATLRLLDHAESAGDDASIVAHSIAAGTDALIQSAYRLAEGHFGRALELIAAIDDPLARHAALGGKRGLPASARTAGVSIP